MAIDERKDYTSADTLTVDDALSLAVMGYRVRADDMQPGAFVDYNFAGWRIHFPGGSSSGWSQREHDYAVDWHVLPDEHYDAYKRVIAERDKPTYEDKVAANAKWGGLHTQKFGRALRPAPSSSPVVVDFDAPRGKAWTLDRGNTPAETVARPAPDNVGKWGKPPAPVVPSKDKWGRPT